MGLSRNKVAVSEGAAGSPPFYGESVGAGRPEPAKGETECFDCCSIFREHRGKEKIMLTEEKSRS